MSGEPLATEASASRRFRSGSDADVDAYLLADGRFFLFCHLSDARLRDDPAYARQLAADFPGGRVMGVGRAWKGDEGSMPLPPVWTGDPPVDGELWAVEDGLRFRLEPERVLNPGLFLDQRDNRRRFSELVGRGVGPNVAAEDGGVLNLFSYTGAFSLVARAAGARTTTSVDLSARYLGWERRNFEGNFEGADAPRRVRDDARDFLRRAVQKKARYRFIVVDPPTFSRVEKKVFRVREHLLPMVRDALACLPEHGPSAILVSTNDARWDENEFFSEVESAANKASATLARGRTPPEFGPAHPLKSAWLLRG